MIEINRPFHRRCPLKKRFFKKNPLFLGFSISALLHIAIISTIILHREPPLRLIQKQECNSWCWAATTSMILARYGKSVPQCEIVSTYTQQSCCVKNACINPLCNVPIAHKDLPALLATYEIGGIPKIGSLTEVELQRELRAGRPIIINTTQAFFINGHTFLLIGYDPPNEVLDRKEARYLVIDPDPDTFDSFVPYSKLLVYREFPYQVWVSSLLISPSSR